MPWAGQQWSLLRACVLRGSGASIAAHSSPCLGAHRAGYEPHETPQKLASFSMVVLIHVRFGHLSVDPWLLPTLQAPARSRRRRRCRPSHRSRGPPEVSLWEKMQETTLWFSIHSGNTPPSHEGMLGGEEWDCWPALGKWQLKVLLCLIRCSALKGEVDNNLCPKSERAWQRSQSPGHTLTPLPTMTQ